MKFKTNSNGQVNSPFELLVSITIMTFVIIIGSQMIMATNDQVCLAEVEKELKEFKLNIEDIAANSGSSIKFEFRPNTKSCFIESKAIINIVKYTDSRKCGAICDKATNSCFVLKFSASDLANGFKSKCLNLPVFTSFVEDPTNCPTDEPALDGYKQTNPSVKEQGLRSGTYILRNVAPAAKTYPLICTYRRA